jgi:hypothetical protein
MAGIQTLFDSLSGVNRPQLNLGIAQSQQLNSLRSAQTDEAMNNAQLSVLKAQGERKQQDAQDQMERNMIDYLGPGHEAEARAYVGQIIAMGVKNPNDVVQAFQGLQTLHAKQTIQDHNASPEAQQEAANSIAGKIAPAATALPPEYQVAPGARPLVTGESPLGAAQVQNLNATAVLHDAQATNPAAFGHADQSAGAAGGPSQLDIDTMADKYNITGALPALGMGASPLRMKILTSAAAAARGERPLVGQTGAPPGGPSAAGGQAANSASFNSSKSAMAALQKQSALVDAYEKTAGMNLDLANSFVNGPGKTLDETGSPLLNRALLHFQQHITGDPATQQFVNALTTSRDEYARVISAATGAQGITDAGRTEANNLFPDSISPQQLGPAILTAKQEMENRSQGQHAQLEVLKQHIANIGATNVSSGGGPSGSVSSGATAPVSAQPPANTVAPPASGPGSNNPQDRNLPPTPVATAAQDNAPAVMPGAPPLGSPNGGGPQPGSPISAADYFARIGH